MKKILLFIVVLVILLGGAYFGWNYFKTNSEGINPIEYIPNSTPRPTKQLSPVPMEIPIESIEVKGEIICLPHKDTSGGVTMECAFGIKDKDTGINYGLSFPDEGEVPPAQTGEMVVIKGDFTPVPDSIYDIAGKIAVRSVEN